MAEAIASLAAEHGLPNSFAIGEISAATDHRITALSAGRVLSDRFVLPVIIGRLSSKGIAFLGVKKRDGRSYVHVERMDRGRPVPPHGSGPDNQ